MASKRVELRWPAPSVPHLREPPPLCPAQVVGIRLSIAKLTACEVQKKAR
jgi:hypothetical protein